ncbi:MAG TPA: hypothetical protein VHE60_04265, partial [Pyrinomonadaceae bacterium]|nr:hypothetical protein [Pyrinomonadaceae bacterium]
WFSMDGPLSRIIANGREGNCGFTLQQAVEAVVAYMQVFHSVHPAVRLGLITNFPNWHYGSIPSYWSTDYGDFQVAFETLLAAVDAAGEKLWFVHADNPYDFATGQQPSDTLSDPTHVDWIQRILDLEAQVRSHGLRFGLIYNSEMGADASDQRYLEDTLAYIKLYRQRGGDPDEAIIESWYDRPSAILPESQPFTFMYTARAALELLQRSYAEGDDVGERASTRGARAECRTRGRSRQPGD